MLDALKTYFAKGNTFHGLEVYQLDNIVKFHLLTMAKKKGELVIENSQGFDQLDELPKLAKISVPICLVYNTKGVITKQTVPKSSFGDKTAAVAQIFPGLNFENFYFQISKLNDIAYVCVAKKQELDGYLVRLKEMKFRVTGLSMGVCSLSHIMGYLKDGSIITNTGKVNVKEGHDTNLTTTYSTSTYNINGLLVKNTEILPFSAVIGFLKGERSVTSNFDMAIENLQSEFKNHRAFDILLRSSLVFILLLLLSNFLFFNFYFNKVRSSKENLVVENVNKKNLITVRERVVEKEKKVDAVLSLSNSKTSFYLDKIGLSVPKSILLTELLYQPLSKSVQESKPIELDENKIMVMGTSMNSESFSRWIIHLESFKWVESVETMDYDYENKSTSSFKIRISVAKL